MSGTQDENPPPPPPQTTQQTPTQQTPHTVSTIKLPILKKGEYDIWAIKWKQLLWLKHTSNLGGYPKMGNEAPVDEQTSSSFLAASQSSFLTGLEVFRPEVDEYDLKKWTLKWQVALILHDNKESILQESVEQREDNRRRDGWNPGNKDGSRTGKKEESKATGDSLMENVLQDNSCHKKRNIMRSRLQQPISD
ncbi:hypothetical protein Tco_0393426 [Tanacetum coccineum]